MQGKAAHWSADSFPSASSTRPGAPSATPYSNSTGGRRWREVQR